MFDDSFSALDFATDARLRAALRARRPPTRPCSSCRSASAPSWTPTGSSSWTMAAWSASARTRSCMETSEVYREIVGVAGRRSRRSHERRTRRAASDRRRRPSMFGRGPMGGFGMPVQKAKDFKGTLRRLLGYLRPHQPALIVVVARRRHRHALQRGRPEDPRPGDDQALRGLPGAKRLGVRRRHRLRLHRHDPAVPGRALRRQRGLPLPAAVPDGGRRAEDGLRDAQARSRRSSAGCR